MSEQPTATLARSRVGILGRRAAGHPYRALRRALVVGWLAAAGVPAGSPVAEAPAPTTLRVLQLNLCNSGRASCYTGRSLTRAAEVIRAERPDLITLNEICQDDVPALLGVFTAVHNGARVVSAFQAAGDRPSGADTRCRDGQPYGIGLLTRLAADSRYAVHSGLHPTQDVADPEERPWLCVHVDGAVHACTTHLAATSRAVALTQCAHLLGEILPAIRRSTGYTPTVLSGDLNLRLGDDPAVRSCEPPGYLRAGDGAVQHVLVTNDLALCCARSVTMGGTTDHPALLATLTIDPRRTNRG
ncbi:endonuclease/exonuclease/phosphatase family protein [Micromonospora sp. STR1_7]|uniref:Endonuclease/exonuclease/phosphatase family protein n=1 Tax=Micromonospora parastrephiae TaxID=2806101 RepID=A0ABS1XY61_9ACTN|nr:endonuclease/exonuclease/phosphatase family protein [Micromonospora parastrephiae]MBM0234216.1 endonuclease/exonuclease/phosphatase family protein [Micromonospora parastrephiae]